jgi:hypothetical protein
MSSTGWIGVDFDGVLAEDAVGCGTFPALGPPIQRMIDRVRGWLDEGKDVRIVTARVHPPLSVEDAALYGKTVDEWVPYQRGLIEHFCLTYFGVPLPVTCAKDYQMIELWDDRCIQMETNTGRLMLESLAETNARLLARIRTLETMIDLTLGGDPER